MVGVEWILNPDILLPKQARYQTALYPDKLPLELTKRWLKSAPIIMKWLVRCQLICPLCSVYPLCLPIRRHHSGGGILETLLRRTNYA